MPSTTTDGRRNAPPAPPAAPAAPAASAGALRGAVGLLKACHPLPAAAVTVLTTALAAAMGLGLATVALAAGAVATGQLSIGWCNDRVDLRRDRASGRRDKPLVTGEVRPRTVTGAAVAALAACVPLSLAYGLLPGAAHLLGVAAAWSYNLRLKSTAASWLPYALAFGLLPSVVTLGLPGAPLPPPWLTAAAALLGAGAHFANVLPDIEDDVATGVLGLPQRLGRRRSAALAALLVVSSSIALAVGPPGPVGVPGGAVLTATVLLALLATAPLPASFTGGRIPFVATMVIAAADVAQLLLWGAELTARR